MNGENVIQGYTVKNETNSNGIGWYTNGDYCDKTGKERVINFEIYCDPNTALKIVSIVEDPICVYTFHLDSRFACNKLNDINVKKEVEDDRISHKMID